MQINSNQPSFQAANFDKRALQLISERVPSGQFDIIVDSFKNKYKDSEFNILIGTTVNRFNRLDAMIGFNTNKKNKDKDTFFKYIEEGVFKSFFSSPVKFLEKVNKVIEQEAMPFAKNGYKKFV